MKYLDRPSDSGFRDGVWVAWGQVFVEGREVIEVSAIFDDETPCARYAVLAGLSVAYVPHGAEVADYIDQFEPEQGSTQ